MVLRISARDPDKESRREEKKTVEAEKVERAGPLFKGINIHKMRRLYRTDPVVCL